MNGTSPAAGAAGAVVLITGAAERAGAEIALALVADEATVVVNHPGQHEQMARLQDRAAGLPGRLLGVDGDIRDRSECRAIVERTVELAGRLDVLVHNASTFRPTPFLEVDEGDFDSSFGVNLRGPFFLSQAAATVMLGQQGGGRIIALAGNSLWEAWPDFVPHAVGKTALARLMELLAVTLSPHVRCNTIAPSQFYRSDDGANDLLRRSRSELDGGADTTVLAGHVVVETAIQDVIEAMRFLIGTTAPVNGVTLRVDGGRSLI